MGRAVREAAILSIASPCPPLQYRAGDADRSLAALMDIVTAALKKGDNVALVGFGTFEVRKCAARNGRTPATSAALKIKAAKAPAFKAGAMR